VVIPISRRANRAKYVTEIIHSGQWAGRKCTIIGGGPSLVDFDFSSIIPGAVIGINKAFLFYPVDINYSMDIRFHDELTYPQDHDPGNFELRKKWSDFHGIKLFLKQDFKARFENSVYVINNVMRKIISMDLSIGIHGGSCSGFGAVMLAIAMGCTKIGLLGYDMAVNRNAGRTHFHDGYEHHKNKPVDEQLNQMQKKLDDYREEIEEFAGNIKTAGIEVFNLSPISAIVGFPKITLNEFQSDAV
jgi:hypothetical protein